MKKLLIISMFVCLLIGVGLNVASAGDMKSDVTIDVSTLPVTGAGSGTASVPANLPEISSNTPTTSILKIVVSNSDAAVAQTISLYDNCLSTDTVTLIWSVVIPSGTYQAQIYKEDFLKNARLPAHRGLYIRKSDTTSTVIASILYE